MIPITNQEAERFLALRQRPRQLPGLLCHPRPARIGCAPREMHATSAELDEEEHVEPLQPDRLHGEEIDGEQAAPMRSDELAPGRARARADWSEATCPKPWRTDVADTATPSPLSFQRCVDIPSAGFLMRAARAAPELRDGSADGRGDVTASVVWRPSADVNVATWSA